jgi:hypothetical protein
VPHIRQRLEVALLGFVSTRCIASEVLIKASFIKKKVYLLPLIEGTMHTLHCTAQRDSTSMEYIYRSGK